MFKRQCSGLVALTLADKLPALLHGYAGRAPCLARRRVQMIFPFRNEPAQLAGGNDRYLRAFNSGQITDKAAFAKFAVPDFGPKPVHRHCPAPTALKRLQGLEQLPFGAVPQGLEKVLAAYILQKDLQTLNWN